MTFSIKSNSIAALAATTLFVFFAAGCSQPAEPAAKPAEPAVAAETPKAAEPVESTPAAFTNDKGEIICPVMGTVIKDVKDAVGHQDHNGKRYYFCCGGCPDQFKDNPSKFEDGKALN